MSLLLIEDDPGDAGLVRAWLGESSEHTYAIDHVQRLSDVADSADYKAAILDLGLPESQGLDTLTLFRRRLPACPVVVFTGCDDPSLARSAAAAGATEFVLKDLAGPSVLSRAIDRAVERGSNGRTERVPGSTMAERFGALKASLNKLDEGIVLLTSDGHVHFANASARALLGVDRVLPLPSPLWELTADGASAMVTSPAEQVLVDVCCERLPIRIRGREARVLFVHRATGEETTGLQINDELALHGFVAALIDRARDLLSRLMCGIDEPSIAITQRALAADILRLSLQLQARLVEASVRAGTGDT